MEDYVELVTHSVSGGVIFGGFFVVNRLYIVFLLGVSVCFDGFRAF